MGYYLQTQEPREKALQLKRDYNAQVVARPKTIKDIPSNKLLICVVENGPFDAAGIMFDDRELEDFSLPTDTRRKTWMLMDRAKVIEMCPSVTQRLTVKQEE